MMEQITTIAGGLLDDRAHQLPLIHSPQAIAQVTTWVREAGRIAMRYFKRVSPQLKPDSSLCTRADTEIEQFLAAQIHSAYPDHGLIGEEGARLSAEGTSPYTWTIDPIDGTTAFVQGLPGWGIALGLLCAGQPVFGLFYMALLDDLTCSVAGGVYEQAPHQGIRPDWGHRGFLAVSSGAHYDFEIDAPRTRTLGSVGASLVYTARGSAMAAFIPKAYVWDLAAGGAILRQSGGELWYLSGKPVAYRSLLDGRLAPEPIIAGDPALLVELQRMILPRNKGHPPNRQFTRR